MLIWRKKVVYCKIIFLPLNIQKYKLQIKDLIEVKDEKVIQWNNVSEGRYNVIKDGKDMKGTFFYCIFLNLKMRC